MLRINRKVPLEKLLTAAGALVVGIFFFITLGIQALSTYRTLVVERQTYQDAIGKLVFDAIKQPLLQGSFFEAKARLQASLARGEVDCIELRLEGLDIKDCRPNISKDLRWYEISLSEVPEFAAYKGKFSIGFDQAPATKALARQLCIILLFTVFGALLVRWLISVGTQLFRKEVQQLTATLARDGPTDFRFRTVEFGLLYDRVEELFRARKKLIESEAFAIIAKTVAHDIRSPLSTLKIVSGKGISNDSVPLLKAATARLEGIANNLLNYSVESSYKPVVFAKDLVPALKNLINEYEVREPEVQFKLEVGPSGANWSAEILPVDVSDLSALADNLLKNACETEGKGGGKISLRLKLKESILELSVTDCGPGISASVLELLGRQPVSHGKPDGKGVGLLLIFKRVKDWGGRFDLLPADPKGTIARLTLDLKPFANSEDRQPLSKVSTVFLPG